MLYYSNLCRLSLLNLLAYSESSICSPIHRAWGFNKRSILIFTRVPQTSTNSIFNSYQYLVLLHISRNCFNHKDCDPSSSGSDMEFNLWSSPYFFDSNFVTIILASLHHKAYCSIILTSYIVQLSGSWDHILATPILLTALFTGTQL